MMGTKEKLSADEMDCFSSWRRLLCRFYHPGVASGIKRRFWRRMRRKDRMAVKRICK